MITERPVNIDLKTALVNNEPVQYAHLIKFERPSRPDSLSGLVSTAKQRYTYLTDASRNVNFDDGSTDLQGNANGTQTYLANKVLSVGSVQEQIKATTSNTSIVLDGNALGANFSATVNVTTAGTGLWDIAILAPNMLEDLLASGFREGDKILFNTVPVNIQSFRANNVLRVSKIDTDLTVGSNVVSTFTLASEEIISILLNKNATDYSSFINREVYIYRAYFKEGAMVGAPFLLFKGIIYNVGFEDSDSGIKVTWGLTSHWGDFAQVNGRVTSDTSHRALNDSGVPQPSSALKPIYAYDKGFIHSETSINTMAKYIVQVEKMDVKYDSGFLGTGIGASVEVKKYYAPEDRYTRLDFQMNAKSIPVVYGVRKIEGIPVFADTLNDNSSQVYIATVLSEGEIGGIYDLYIEGNSLICNDKADADARSTENSKNTIPLVCRGRADAGDALGGVVSSTAATSYSYYSSSGELISISQSDIFNGIASWTAKGYVNPIIDSSVVYNNYGLLDGQSLAFSTPQEISIDLFTGKTGQEASAQLCQIAYNKNFKIQNSYWKGSNTSEYWGPNHRLLDTAYVVTKFKIAEGETTIPEISYVVRGKLLNCYNYDYSFLHDRKQSTELASNFSLGDYVTLYYNNGTSDVVLNTSVQIIDKWTFKNPDGTDNVRFIFSDTPALGWGTNHTPTITKFFMKNASNNVWTMTTYNHNILSGTVPGPVMQQISSVISSGSGNIEFRFGTNANMAVVNDEVETSPRFQVLKSDFSPITSGDLFPFAIMSGTVSTVDGTTMSFVSGYPYSFYSVEASSLVSSFPQAILASKNTIRLPASASSTNNFYKDDIIEVTRYNNITGKSVVQNAIIVGYNGTSNIATIDSIWDFIPNTGDTFKVYPKYADSRVSINPAIQTLDYITSKTYGRGLDPVKDIDLPSWCDTARRCDQKSNVTMLFTTDLTGVVVGATYRYPATGKIQWQGKVASKSGQYITFTDVIGKITNKWFSWKNYSVDSVIYVEDGSRFYRVNSAGTIVSEPSGAGTLNPSVLYPGSTCTSITNIGTTLSLSLVSGSTGTATLALNMTKGNPVQSLKSGQKASGYSLYDSDDITYWRLSGWDEHSQRYVTKHQTNMVLDTSISLFENINGLLDHYNGILRYTAGKYYLDIEELADEVPNNDIRIITADDIIGRIQLSDEGSRSSFNSLTAAFADPANKFEARNISFFNSDYLKADKNVPKKGNLSVPGVTNYYNTRLLANGFLTKSRYGLTINMTVRTHGILLLAGTVIQVVYPRYGWISPGKKFRIESVTYQADGYTDIVAKEYDDSFYSIANIKRVGGSGPSLTPINTGVGSPSNLIITSADTEDELLNGVELFWDNNPAADSSNCYTEIYGGLSPSLFTYVSNITGGDTFITTAAHGLQPGMPVYPTASSSGLVAEDIYYVVSVPTTTSFKLTATKNNTTPDTFTNGSGLNIQIRTATLLATVPVPIRSYVDNVVNEGTGRVEKYYWVRHKVIEA